MKNSDDLETKINDATSSFTKSVIGINAGGVLLLGSLLNALLAIPDRDSTLITVIGLTMYLGIAGVLMGLTSQFRELKLLVTRKGQRKSHEGYNRCFGIFVITIAFALLSYLGVGLKLSFFK